MILNFVWPSTPRYSGGVIALYEFANALSRRGHEVHFIHGPAWIERIESLDQLPADFEPGVQHHLPDDLDDPDLPEGDVVFAPSAPARLGLPLVFIQGHKMIPEPVERAAFRSRCPKLCVASWLIDLGVEEYGVPREQLFHVPLGIEHHVFRIRTPLDRRPVDVALLHHAHPSKGWSVGEQALEIVRARRPDLRVDVYGVEPPHKPVPDWMRFHLNLDREGLGRGFDHASIFLQPSWNEGFGFTAVEAMASGCALVSTDNGGSRDYAIHEETALVVPAGDPEVMAQAIERLLGDDAERTALAQAGEAHARRFDWDEGAVVLEAVLEQYLADPEALQRPPAPSEEPDIAFTFSPGTLMPVPTD